MDLGTQIGHMTHLKKWSFFHQTPYLSMHTSSIQAASWQAYSDEGSWC